MGAEERKKEEEGRRLKSLEKQVESLDDQPFVDELTRIDQCTRFCKSLLPKETGSKQEEKKETVHNNKAGEVVMLSKEDRAAEEFFFAPTKVKSKKGKKSGGAGDEKKKDQKITLNMDNFGDWAFLKIEPPMFVSDLEATLVKLEEKKVHFEEKVKDWEENKEEMKRKILAGEISVQDLKKDGKEETAQSTS